MSERAALHRNPILKPGVNAVDSRTEPPVELLGKEQKVEVLGSPIKSLSDKKLYKTIRLQNGLTALLISDPKAPEKKPAACALTVGVGSFSDPRKVQGLAHFVEHMVFMGSKKYPEENEFDAFTEKNGGVNNAETDCEMTTFYFGIPGHSLSQTMDMLSQFFISPLMRKEAMQREREAVESEFAMVAPSDSHRVGQLLLSLFPKGHPARTFLWGNLRSLRDDLTDQRLYCAAHKFRRRHYSAHRMTVAVQARMNLTTLEQYVANTFGQIPSNKLPPDDYSRFAYSPDAVTPEFRSLYYVKPISDASEVRITWCMPSLLSDYQSKPQTYIAFMLGHEGKGSLLSYLRKKLWALDIYASTPDTGMEHTSIYSLFSLHVVLTKDGLEHLDEVLAAVFSYLNMLRYLGPSERIFNEIKKIADNGFRYQRETQPVEYVKTLSIKMHLYPPEHYITGDQLYYEYDSKIIMDLLDLLRADKSNIMVLSDKHTKPIQYDAKEKWFGTEYKREEIPQEWLQRWMNVTPYSEFHIPEKNVYITKNFDIIPAATPYVETAEKLGLDLKTSSFRDIQNKMANQQPETKTFKKDDLIATINNFRLDQPNLFRKNRHMELWYKPDFKWRFPIALLYFYFIMPLGLRSPREMCLLDLWNDVLQEGHKENVYPASLADLSHEMFVADQGLMLKISGYSENLHLLVDLITSGMRNSSEAVTPQLFEAVREVRARKYHNLVIDPNKLAEDVGSSILWQPYISLRDKAAWVHNITLEEFQDFGQRLLKKMYLQVLIQGNIPWDQAINITEKVHHDLNWEGMPEVDQPEVKVLQLPLGERRVRVMSLNKFSTNSIVTNYYQGGVATAKDKATLAVIMILMREPLFDKLRTKEQLGYTVTSTVRHTFGVVGFSVTVNSQIDKFSVQHVDKRVEAFLKQFSWYIKGLSENVLPANKTFMKVVLPTDFKLQNEVDRNWEEIMNREYCFQRIFKESAAIDNITLTDIMMWLENHLASGNKSMFRKLSVQIMGHQVKKDHNVTAVEPDPAQMTGYKLTYLNSSDLVGEASKNASEFIIDIDEFRKEQRFWKVSLADLQICRL